MKKTIILLALIGLTYSGANAQTKKTEKTTETTKVCKCHSAAKLVKDKDGQLVHKHLVHKAKSASDSDTYQICREEGGHYSCCKHHSKTTVTTAAK